jgi:RNA-dependent RNA polymerase
MLRLSIPSSIHRDRLRGLLEKKFVLCGRVFIAIRPKDAKSGKPWKVYLIEVNEDVDRQPKVSEGDCQRLTLREFVRWHNPMQLNSKQVRYPSFMTFTQLTSSSSPFQNG